MPGVAGAEPIFTNRVWLDELPQALLAITEILPALLPTVAKMLSVVELPDQVLGNDHVYDVAPVTAATENVSKAPLHTLPVSVIEPGVAGVAEDTVTASVCAVELPQLLLAVTETVPPVEPTVLPMLDVVDVPVQPLGSVHV